MTEQARGKMRDETSRGQALRGVRELKTEGRPEQAEGESEPAEERAEETVKQAVTRRASIRRTRRSS